METCENCRYSFLSGGLVVHCRRRPPTLWIGQGQLGQSALMSSFPPVSRDWTCGEFGVKLFTGERSNA